MRILEAVKGIKKLKKIVKWSKKKQGNQKE